MSATGKQTKTRAPKATTSGTEATERRRKQPAPQLSEKTKKLTLKAFRMTYEAHQPQRDAAMKETVAPSTPASSNSKSRNKATKPARKKELSANEATLRAWKKTYENRHPTEKAPTR